MGKKSPLLKVILIIIIVTLINPNLTSENVFAASNYLQRALSSSPGIKPDLIYAVRQDYIDYFEFNALRFDNYKGFSRSLKMYLKNKYKLSSKALEASLTTLSKQLKIDEISFWMTKVFWQYFWDNNQQLRIDPMSRMKLCDINMFDMPRIVKFFELPRPDKVILPTYMDFEKLLREERIRGPLSGKPINWTTVYPRLKRTLGGINAHYSQELLPRAKQFRIVRQFDKADIDFINTMIDSIKKGASITDVKALIEALKLRRFQGYAKRDVSDRINKLDISKKDTYFLRAYYNVSQSKPDQAVDIDDINDQMAILGVSLSRGELLEIKDKITEIMAKAGTPIKISIQEEFERYCSLLGFDPDDVAKRSFSVLNIQLTEKRIESDVEKGRRTMSQEEFKAIKDACSKLIDRQSRERLIAEYKGKKTKSKPAARKTQAILAQEEVKTQTKAEESV